MDNSKLADSWKALQEAAFKFGPTQDWDKFISENNWVWALWNEAYFKGQV